MTLTARESMDRFVTARDAARIASAMPGACRVATARVPSGVMSRGPNPVPPVVKIKSSCRWSANRINSFLRGSMPSGSSSSSTTS